MSDMPQPLLEEVKKKNDYAEKLSDRTRTSCLGALAVIWAIFAEKKADSALNVSRWSKIALLVIAIGAVLVLAFDFIEAAFGYIRTRQTSGTDKVTLKNYKQLEDTMRSLKLIAGPVMLIALCVVLGLILCMSLYAQEEHSAGERRFIGTWCGASAESDGNAMKGSYRCINVHISTPGNNMTAKVGYPDEGDKLNWIDCTSYTFADPVIIAHCPGDGDIKLGPTTSDEVIDYIRGGEKETHQLLREVKNPA